MAYEGVLAPKRTNHGSRYEYAEECQRGLAPLQVLRITSIPGSNIRSSLFGRLVRGLERSRGISRQLFRRLSPVAEGGLRIRP